MTAMFHILLLHCCDTLSIYSYWNGYTCYCQYSETSSHASGEIIKTNMSVIVVANCLSIKAWVNFRELSEVLI